MRGGVQHNYFPEMQTSNPITQGNRKLIQCSENTNSNHKVIIIVILILVRLIVIVIVKIALIMTIIIVIVIVKIAPRHSSGSTMTPARARPP